MDSKGTQRNKGEKMSKSDRGCFLPKTTQAGAGQKGRAFPEKSSPRRTHHTQTFRVQDILGGKALLRPEPLLPQISIECQRCAGHSSQSENISKEITHKLLSSKAHILIRRKAQ